MITQTTMILVFNSDCTQDVYAIEAPMAHHKQGLQWTATGYGKKIPTVYKVFYNGLWRRVYADVYGNSGSCYIIVKGNRITVR